MTYLSEDGNESEKRVHSGFNTLSGLENINDYLYDKRCEWAGSLRSWLTRDAPDHTLTPIKYI
jgi:hypothetical protein